MRKVAAGTKNFDFRKILQFSSCCHSIFTISLLCRDDEYVNQHGINKTEGFTLGFRKKKNFSFLQIAQTGCAAHPAFCSIETWSLSLRIKRPEHEADNSLASSAKVRNECIYNSVPCTIGASTGTALPSPFLTALIFGKTKTLICIFYRR